MNIVDEYRRSLKSVGGEEIFDVIFYRPLALLVVRVISRTPVTPNQVTTLSLLAGVGSAFWLAHGTPSALAWSAVVYAFANVLDCADGQLARLQKSGTPLGRVWDGVADYISSVAIFLAIWWISPGHLLWLVLFAGISSAVHAMVFDYYQRLFILAGKDDPVEEEIRRLEDEISQAASPAPRMFFLGLYVAYLKQQRAITRRVGSGGKTGLSIRYWSFLGPTTNRTALIVCMLVARVDLYLAIVAFVGNLWMVMCVLLQNRPYRKY